jgi:hypothetical protein
VDAPEPGGGLIQNGRDATVQHRQGQGAISRIEAGSLHGSQALFQLRDAAGAAHHLAHLLQPLRVTTQAAAGGQGLALLALQVGGG